MIHRLLLALATLAAYWNCLFAGLPFDSVALVRDDPRMHAITRGSVGAILTQNYWGTRFQSGLYRPVVTLSYLLQHGAPAWAYHLVNLGLHVIAALLAYELIRRIAPRVAFWAALLWAVHPINTEAVTSVAGRPDLMAAIAVLGGLTLYTSMSTWDTHRGKLAALAGLTLLGVFSKESAVMLLPLCFLYDWCQSKDRNRLAVAAIAFPTGLMLIVRGLLSIGAGMQKPYVDNPIVGASWIVGKLTALQVIGKLVKLWMWPRVLSADYSYSQIPLWHGEWSVLLVILGFGIAVLWAFIHGFDSHPQSAMFAVLGFSLAMAPTSNLIFTTGSIMAERFMYLPGVALSALLVGNVMRIRHVDLRASALVLILGALTGATLARNQDYFDDLRFWQATVRASPNSFKARTQLAAEYHHRGLYGQALAEADRTAEILKDLPAGRDVYEPWTMLWAYYILAGQADKAHYAADRVAACFNAMPRMRQIPQQFQ